MENILSVEDQNFLENIHKNFGIQNIICDDNGVNLSEMALKETFNDNNIHYLTQIFSKLKYKLHSNFRMEFSSFGFNINKI